MIEFDKEAILDLSEKIRESWNLYFWEYRVCQWRIRFTDEERTNYVGDVFNYFDDITKAITAFDSPPDYLSALYETTAVLQLMFVQQDLIDELRLVFKMPQSASVQKSIIRELRNELIGHPISRKDGLLKSSVFITAQTRGNSLEYLRYHKENSFKFEVIARRWDSLFHDHHQYLISNLRDILKRIDLLLGILKKSLKGLYENCRSVQFETLVHWTERVYDVFGRNNYLYAKNCILYCWQRKTTHRRYQYAIDLYVRDLSEYLKETISQIDEFQKTCLDSPQIVNFSEDIDIVISGKKYDRRKGKDIHYEFGKLYEDHPIFGIQYFLKTFASSTEIVDELLNMQQFGRGHAEFYCSYYYLRKILVEKRLLA
jgi:hypothetical protein